VLFDVLQFTVLGGHTYSRRSATNLRNGVPYYLLPTIYVSMCPRYLVLFVIDPLQYLFCMKLEYNFMLFLNANGSSAKISDIT
jgi:hypothetical protein